MSRKVRYRHEVDSGSDWGCVSAKTPELALLRALLKRAILDAIEPHAPHVKVRKDKDAYWRGLVDEWKRSKLTLRVYAARKSIPHQTFEYHVQRLKAEHSGFHYIFEDTRDASEEWSFDWVLSHLFEDVDRAKKNIRQLVLKKINLTRE